MKYLLVGKTSLHLAVENDNIKLVQHLLLHGVSPDVKDNQGKYLYCWLGDRFES